MDGPNKARDGQPPELHLCLIIGRFKSSKRSSSHAKARVHCHEISNIFRRVSWDYRSLMCSLQNEVSSFSAEFV